MGEKNYGESFKSSTALCSAVKECFNWKSNCFLCGKSLSVNKKIPIRYKEIFKAGENDSMSTIKKKIQERDD